MNSASPLGPSRASANNSFDSWPNRNINSENDAAVRGQSAENVGARHNDSNNAPSRSHFLASTEAAAQPSAQNSPHVSSFLYPAPASSGTTYVRQQRPPNCVPRSRASRNMPRVIILTAACILIGTALMVLAFTIPHALPLALVYIMQACGGGLIWISLHLLYHIITYTIKALRNRPQERESLQ